MAGVSGVGAVMITPEEQAEKLFPCTCPMAVGWMPDEHELKCPAWYRQVVTAALAERERQGIILGLKKALEIVGDAGYVVEASALGDLVAEIERAEHGGN